MILSYLVLAVAAFAAGIISAVAGGGAFLVFPALLLTGLDPRAANITATMALYPMQVSNGFTGRKEAAGTQNLSFRDLFVISLVGGVIGAVLLLLTPANSFGKLVPWLLMFATLVFAWGSLKPRPARTEAPRDRLGRIGAALVHFAISIYGGYFGGGIGLLMLATLTYAGMNMRAAGNTKNILAAVMNTSAVGVFFFSNDVYWGRAGVAAICAITGGLIGVRLLDKINERALRRFVVVIGAVMTMALFLRAHFIQ
jgi:uncharacterized membrane protein YfcA